MKKNFLLVSGLVFVIFLSGCIGDDVTDFAENIPQVREFLEEYPDADISAVRLDSNYLQDNKDKIHEECLDGMDLTDEYYRVIFSEDQSKIITWIDTEMELICAIKEGYDEDPDEGEQIPEAVMEAFDFLEEMPELQMAELELLGYEDTDSGVYLFTVLLSADAPQMDPYGEMEEEMDFFVSKDGDMFFMEGEEINLDDPSVEEIGEEGAKALTELIGLGQMSEEDLEVNFNQVLDTIDGTLYRLEMMLSGEFDGEAVEQVMESYATTDGKYFFAEGMNITETRLFMEEMEDDATVEDEEKDTDEEGMGEFIVCLDDVGVKIYGAEWCPYCTDLAESLGGYETVDPIWVECTEEGERCDTEKQTTAVPEVQLDGEVIDARNPEALAQETGCELP